MAVYIKEALMYRAELMVWRAIDAIPILAMLTLWVSVYSHGNQMGQYSLRDILTYYILGNLIQAIVVVHFEEEGVRWVNDGSIARFFLKPFTFFHHAVIGSISWRAMSMILAVIPIVSLLMIVFREVIVIPHIWTLIAVLLAIVLGYGIDVMVSLLIVAAAFYFEQARALAHLKWMLAGVFGGSMLPLSLFPPWMESLGRFLPFQYQFAIPVEMYLGMMTGPQAAVALVKGTVWILVLAFIVAHCWQTGVKKFSAAGG